jgi:hypothetical protein
MLAFVRTRVLWSVGVGALIAVCVVAPVVMVRSTDAQAGLAMFLILYIGVPAAALLAIAETIIRHLRRRRARPPRPAS